MPFFTFRNYQFLHPWLESDNAKTNAWTLKDQKSFRSFRNFWCNTTHVLELRDGEGYFQPWGLEYERLGTSSWGGLGLSTPRNVFKSWSRSTMCGEPDFFRFRFLSLYSSYVPFTKTKQIIILAKLKSPSSAVPESTLFEILNFKTAAAQ